MIAPPPAPTTPSSEPVGGNPAASGPAASGSSAGRDLVLDNARAILIVLVVLGHLLSQVPGPFAKVLSVWIYSFHMPAFVFVSGYLARSYRGAPHQVARIVSGLLVPYVIFQTVHALIRFVTVDGDFPVQYLKPTWTLWFLLALAMWRIVTPVLQILRWPLLTAILLAVLMPLMDNLNQTMTLARFFSFLPFFVAGMVVKPHHLALLRARTARWLGAAVLVAGLAAVVLLRDDLRKGLFTLDLSYDAMGLSPAGGIAVRVLVLATGAVGTVAVLALAPATRQWWTFVGQQTMYVYLLHAVLINWVRHLDWPDLWGTAPFVGLVFPLIAVAMTLLLASAPVVAATRWLVEPPLVHMLVDPDRARAERQDASARRRSGSR